MTVAHQLSIAVVKIGGSVLTGRAAYQRAAAFIAGRVADEPGTRLVVVVSAEHGMTDALFETACESSTTPDPVMRDLLWSTGELRSVALVALGLQALGVQATGVNVHQTGLLEPDTAGAAGRTALPSVAPARAARHARRRGRARISGARGRRFDRLARPWRLRPDGGLAGRGSEGGPLRAREGCSRVLLVGPQSRSGRAPSPRHRLRGSARDGLGRLRARATGRARVRGRTRVADRGAVDSGRTPNGDRRSRYTKGSGGARRQPRSAIGSRSAPDAAWQAL